MDLGPLIIISVENSRAAQYWYIDIYLIFQDSQMNRKFKRAERNILLHYKCLYCHFWSV